MAAKNKSYLNNPALQFISSALVDEANGTNEAATAQQQAQQPAQPVQRPAAPVQSVPAPVAEPAPVMQSAAAPQPQMKFIVPMKPVFVETRSKRFNALMQPSLYDNLLKIASANGVSVNELMHRVLEKFVEDNMQ